MREHFNYLVIDGKSSRDFDAYLTGAGTFSSPERSYEEVQIPGKNGTIFLYDGNFKNIEVSYEGWIARPEDPEYVYQHFREMKNFLLSRKGYFRLEDTYHPDEFRFANYISAIEPEMLEDYQGAVFTLKFNCKPQRFLKKYYDYPLEYLTTNQRFINETYFEAKPLIRAYGTGTFTINGVSLKINSASSYTDIDCELQEAYKDTFATNCNGNITLTNGKFPVIEPGVNTITFTGITKLVIYPRLYVI